MNSYQSIIFDLGNVVFDVSFDRVFQSWANASGQPFDQIKANFKFDGLCQRFEKDELAPSQFRKEMSQQLNLKLSDEQFDKGWCDLYLDIFPGIDKLLNDLKSSYKLVALTNTNSIHQQVWTIKYADSLKHFEKVFCSNEIKTRKPEKKAYEIVLDYLRLKPNETIFLDDNIENVRIAEGLGMKAIQVSSQRQLNDELKKAGVRT